MTGIAQSGHNGSHHSSLHTCFLLCFVSTIEASEAVVVVAGRLVTLAVFGFVHVSRGGCAFGL